MKELYEIHDKILLRGIEVDPERRINFSRDEFEDLDEKLPEDLRPAVESLQHAINACLPDDFDYFAFVGSEVPPQFDLMVDNMPVGDPDENLLDPEQSMFPQLKELDWDKLRAKSQEFHQQMTCIDDMLDFIERPRRSTKQIQRDFREDCKNFIKDKRRDTSKIHVLWWSESGLLINEFADGDKLRHALPSLTYKDGEIISILVFGRPLPVERIDALIAEAHRIYIENLETTIGISASATEADGAEDRPAIENGKPEPE